MEENKKEQQKQNIIKTIADFNRWIEGLKGLEGKMLLYRGLASKDWEVAGHNITNHFPDIRKMV